MNENNNNAFPDLTDQFAPDDINQNKNMAAVACIPCLFWLPLVTNSKDSPFAKFYSNQGLILLIGGVVLSILSSIISAILSNLGAIGGVMGGLIGFVCGVLPFAGFIYEIVAAVNGKAKPLPVVGTLVQIIK